MMAPQLSDPRLRRAAFIGGNLLALVAFVLLVISPIRAALMDGEAEIARQAETLARYRALAQHRPEAPSPAEAQFAREAFLTGPNEGVAAANLQARLQAVSTSLGARLRSVQGVASRSEGSLRFIGARLEIFGPLQAVHQAIHAIEAAKPFLFVTATTLKLSPTAALPGNTAQPILEAQIDILGAFRPEGGK
jgi:general secretion pathway protein M